MKLYHYPHCPFCQRVRLFLGFKNIPYESIELSYDDKKTTDLLGFPKSLPIIDFDDGKRMNESLDIIREVEYRFPNPIGFIGPIEGILQWASMAAVGIPRYFDLLLPWYPDHYKKYFEKFPSGAKFYQEGKEKKQGQTFFQLKEQRIKLFNENIRPHLGEIIEKVEYEYFIMGPTFSVADCVLAADLSGLRIIPDLNLPKEITHYIERAEVRCRTKLLEA